MASVFLSYVRDDAGKARSLAGLLERAGHSVWWDRRIKGGAQYSSEIEAALAAADKIIVLWSARSIGSAWVRDEAAVGRDSGRLVPVTIDGTDSPLGFRQFQTLDFSAWNGRTKPHGLDDLLAAVGPPDEREESARPAMAAAATPGPARPARSSPLIAATAALLVVVIGGGWWWTSRAGPHTPIVAVAAANGSPKAQQIAHDLAVQLGALQSARGDAFELVLDPNDADIVLRLNAQDSPDALRRDLTFESGKNHAILWSTSFAQPPAKAGDLAQQLTATSQRVLSCALEALSDRKDQIDATTLKLYLTGCARLGDVFGLSQYDPGLDHLFEQVIARAPHFEGAWANLLAAESEIARIPDTPAVLIDRTRGHIAQAQKLGLNIGEIYAAKAALLPQSDFLGILDLYSRGIAADPDNSFLYRLRSEEWQRVGRMSDAIGDADQARKLDPLSPAVQDNYVSALAYAGKIDAAYEQLRQAEAIWPNARNIQFARYRLDIRYGDPKNALAAYRGGIVSGGEPAMETLIEARIDPSPAKIQRAIDAERVQYAQDPRYIAGLVQALAQFGRTDEAIDTMLGYKRLDAIGYNAEVLFRPAMQSVWRDPRAMAVAAHLGFLRVWEKSGKWPDFCAEPELKYDCRKEAAKYRV
jgi:tetratricopeptide (TPR) repeat protein